MFCSVEVQFTIGNDSHDTIILGQCSIFGFWSLCGMSVSMFKRPGE